MMARGIGIYHDTVPLRRCPPHHPQQGPTIPPPTRNKMTDFIGLGKISQSSKGRGEGGDCCPLDHAGTQDDAGGTTYGGSGAESSRKPLGEVHRDGEVSGDQSLNTTVGAVAAL
mmetsp:Transcript_14094/g.13898  ORF Transcript_14094/g.13898 Transcript_14094/m.13898 type:complete len:114 (+) Transcript_14094:214-555(+)